MNKFWVDGGESKSFTVDERDAKQGSMCSAMLVRICSPLAWKKWRALKDVET